MSTELTTRPNVKSGEIANFAATADMRQKLVCKDMLRGDSIKLARQEAESTYQAMLGNTLIIATFGSDVLTGLNDLVKKAFEDIKINKNSEIGKIVRTLGKTLDGVHHRYNTADPKFVAKYEQTRRGFLGIFGGTAAFWRQFMRDVRSIQSQVNSAESSLDQNLIEVADLIAYYQTKYEATDAELDGVIYKIAVMELIIDLAAEELESLPKGDDYDSSEARSKRADLIQNLTARISGYKTRLFMGWTDAPKTRANISLNIGIYSNIGLTKDVTLPLMLQTMIDIHELSRSQDMTEVNEAFRATLNQALQQYAEFAAVTVPLIVEANSRPILVAKTIEVMRDAYIRQTEGVLKAMEESDKQNAILDALYVDTAGTFRSESERVTDAVLDRVVKATHQLEISTAIPATSQQ